MIEISIVYEIYDDLDSPEVEYPPNPPPKPALGSLSGQSGSVGSYSSNTSDGKVFIACHYSYFEHRNDIYPWTFQDSYWVSVAYATASAQARNKWCMKDEGKG